MSNKVYKVYNRSRYAITVDGVSIEPHSSATFTDIRNKTLLNQLVAKNLIQYSEEERKTAKVSKEKSTGITMPNRKSKFHKNDSNKDIPIGDDE